MIRRLVPGDARAFWDLRYEALTREPRAFASAAEDFESQGPDEMASRFRESDLDAFAYGFFAEDRLCAFAGFSRNRGLKVRHSGMIWGVYVTPEYRGRGLSRAVMTTLLEAIRECPGIERVTLGVSDGQAVARRLYLSLGFAPYGLEPDFLKIGDEYVAEEHMFLRLR